ncbi:MAG: hypothetical protein J6J29_04160 [Paludibacteraceae bacterium]|nr:hypothetical protein [Paludibacteraceae bacterium]
MCSKRNYLSNPPLWLCLLMDAIGCMSYFIPVWGEYIDLIWGPIAAFAFYMMYGGNVGKVGALITLAEEVTPYTDFLPVFTLAYFLKVKSEK